MLRALIVDDEAPARAEMKYLLSKVKQVQVCGEASNVHEAVTLIKTVPADVLFLDIHMPGFSGLQLAEGLKSHPSPPAIVFVTAHSKHALAAFDANAVDYLMKPVDVGRLEIALSKVIEKNADAQDGELEFETRITVSKGNKKFLLNPDEIAYCMAKDDYSYVYTAHDHYLSTTSLTAYEDRLADKGFFRAHRRYLVNLDWISTVEPTEGSSLLLTMKDDSQSKIPVSRRRVVEFKRIAGF
ncbi:MAG: LytTR family DNA-binding domain-containing protein [Actinomycetia bacterium]|nr:LytTR family DNA-binding domain-containing protein [Actinomycetes bacterium]